MTRAAPPAIAPPIPPKPGPTQILVASVRHPMHVVEAAKIGADVMTAPPKIIWQLFKHPLTDAGIASFLKDWQATGQKIG